MSVMGKSGNLSGSAKSDGLDFNAPSSRLFSTRPPAKKDEEKTEVEIAKSGERSERERERQRALKDSAKKFAWTAALMHAFRIESRPMHRLHKKYGPQTSEAAARQASLTQPKPSYRNIPLCALSRRQRLVRTSTPLQVPSTKPNVTSWFLILYWTDGKRKGKKNARAGRSEGGSTEQHEKEGPQISNSTIGRERAEGTIFCLFFFFLVAHPPHLNAVCAPLHEKVSVSWQKCSDFFFLSRLDSGLFGPTLRPYPCTEEGRPSLSPSLCIRAIGYRSIARISMQEHSLGHAYSAH